MDTVPCANCGLVDHASWCLVEWSGMPLYKQPSKWSCLPTSFAMVTRTPLSELMLYLGHDDERGFHPEELFAWALTKGWAFVAFYPASEVEGTDDYSGFKRVPVDELLKDYSGVMMGKDHAVAWDHERQKVLDPNFTVYDSFPFEVFFLGVKWKN